MTYVALDIGNVLVYANFNDFLKRLSKALNITIEEALYFMNRSQKLHDLGLTKMSDELRDHFKIRSPVTIEELVSEWNSVIVPCTEVLDRLNHLTANHKVKVALLSNVGLEHAEQMARVLNHGDFFEKAIKHFSCHVGARKPNILYYHTFLQLHPQFYNCVYVDDLQENLDASKQFGFKTFRFSLEEITGANYEEGKFQDKLEELETVILDQHEPPNSRWH